MTTITCPENGTTGVCQLMGEAGAGLGLLFQYLAQSLPAFLLILAVVGGIVLIVGAVGKVIGNSVTGYRGRFGK